MLNEQQFDFFSQILTSQTGEPESDTSPMASVGVAYEETVRF